MQTQKKLEEERSRIFQQGLRKKAFSHSGQDKDSNLSARSSQKGGNRDYSHPQIKDSQKQMAAILGNKK